MTLRQSYDVVIVGGAVMGCSVAYHLAADPAFRGSVLVLEQDLTYQRCATARSVSSIRQQFSTACNIKVSLAGIEFLRRAGELLEVEGERPDVGLKEPGYTFLASEAGMPVLTENHALQTRLGADILLLDPAGLVGLFPWLNTDGVAAGSWGRTGEGWLDGYALMQAFKRKARALGAAYAEGQVVELVRKGGRVIAVRLADGRTIGCGYAVNTAGIGATALARTAGIDIPVRPRKRMVFTFQAEDRLGHFPLLIDASGVYCRPEGNGYVCGSGPPEGRPDPDTDNLEVDYGFFDEVIWPVLAHRVPAFERIKPGPAWAGIYDLNVFDYNAIVGASPELPNLLIANGFSGHGLQQAPAVGRAIAELIAHKRFVTLDLSDLGYARIAEGRPLVERNVV